MRFTRYIVLAASCFLLLGLIPGGSADSGTPQVSLAARVSRLEARVKKLEREQIALRTLVCLQILTC